MLSPIGVFSASLLVSLALWWPTMLACLHGRLGLPAAGLRYLVAFVLCRAALGALSRLVTTYYLATGVVAARAAAEQEAAAAQQRRRDDQLV